jgi:hypothetical protein
MDQEWFDPENKTTTLDFFKMEKKMLRRSIGVKD